MLRLARAALKQLPCLIAGAVLLVSGCREPSAHSSIVPSDSGPFGDSVPARADAGAPSSLCGSLGEICCAAPLPRCEAELRCGAASDRCEPIEPAGAARLCRNSADCSPETSCCPNGLLGSCESLAASDCPSPDLTLVASIDAKYLSFSAEQVSPTSCSLELGCAAAAGRRRLLHFDAEPINAGGTELLLGDSQSSKHAYRALCDGQRYLLNYLRSELVDANGVIVATSTPALAFAPGIEAELPPDYFAIRYPATACDGIDITGVPAGEYTLRTTINPDRLLFESNYSNDSISIHVTLPAFDDPLAPCSPDRLDYFTGDPEARECGWSRASLQPNPCTPGNTVQIACASCGVPVALRVCEGGEACSWLSQLSGPPDYSADACPTIAFECPPTGNYTVLTSIGYVGLPAGGVTMILPEPYECSIAELPHPQP